MSARSAGSDRSAMPQSRTNAEVSKIYSRIVERYAMGIDRPEVRLRFLNSTLAKQSERQLQLQQSLHLFKFLENTRFYDWATEARLYSTILEEIESLSKTYGGKVKIPKVEIPLLARTYFMVYQARHVFYGLGVVLTGLLLFGLYSMATWSARNVNTFLAQRYQRGRAPIVVTTSGQGQSTAFAATGAKYLPGYKPEKVWQVEKNSEFERYSNGARIVLKYETDNHPRGYYLIPRGSDSEGTQLRRDPIGIVYHTSESDIVPFISSNNQSIKHRSLGLIEYIQKNKSYNYLIDRYGEIYRIVRDDNAAHHAGHSIWADEKYDYVGLNESFIGICFESTSEAGSLEETLTEAQIMEGRKLTNVLRSRYNIEDVNCTTHGLVSVNPDKLLIAYHHDWVRNFPFEAMGLSDKYKVPPPNMLDYGFSYDEQILEKLGSVLWPGAVAADEEFKRRADRARTNPDLLRRRLRDRYNAQLEKARKLRTPTDDSGNSTLSAQSSITSSTAESGDAGKRRNK